MSLIVTSKIEKELIGTCVFVTGREMLSKEERRLNELKLYRAMLLGNGAHCKVKIHFSTEQGMQMVETTVWAYTDGFVMLKGGVFIPTDAIVGVDLA